jgi:histidine triad (HIT) family protein
VIGLEVPHAHVHLIPLNGMADINFANPKLQLGKEELTSIAKKINSQIEGL